MLKYALVLSFVLFGATIAYIRLMPVTAERYHVDPTISDRPERKGHILIRQGGDTEPQSFDMTASELANRVELVILATPRTVKLAGDLESTHASYVDPVGSLGVSRRRIR